MKKGDLMRDEILAAAEELFFTNGYEDTGVQDILDALKLSKGGFYHYFNSKESVMREICRAPHCRTPSPRGAGTLCLPRTSNR